MDEIIIWGEVLFLIDFSMDFCAFYFSGKLLGWKINLRRLIAAASICAIVGLFCTARLSERLSLLCLCSSWFISIPLIIPKSKCCLKNIIYAVILFVFFETCIGGIMTVMFYQMNRMFSSFETTFENGLSRLRFFFLSLSAIFFCLAIMNRILSNTLIQQTIRQNGTVTISWNGRSTVISCLFDSGNLVREPISGKHVMVVPSNELQALGIDADLLCKGAIYGSRLIPMKTLDSTTVSWGILPNQIQIKADNKTLINEELYVVFSAGTDIAIIPSCIFR